MSVVVCITLTWRKQRKIIRHRDMLKFSERLDSQHQEKTLLLRGAALASLFTIHKIQVSLSNSVQAFHISVVCRQTTASSLLLSVFGFPILKLGFWWGPLLQSVFFNILHPIQSFPHGNLNLKLSRFSFVASFCALSTETWTCTALSR